ncbi:hypothetical protein K435DRAFT_668150 [Dendrothele bispora CBS 962.96]|uniref:2OGFeDO JBP1/TET oxygenase domain-containing protein n=2 Tax=Dendrothele bispora (strain CBS 962.96) TaxID=1314807 RepID=A0A4S8LYN6_DENBC|nr:hypothetical protein K435DRAFT_668150 [Dendrothele bispora CBS 962.96]
MLTAVLCRESVPIVDSQERIIALLAGNPVNDSSWPAIIEEAARELEDAREQLIVDKEAQEHRRGKYVAASVGNSIGGGQKPMPFKQHPANDPVIQRLLSSKPFERLAGWASSAFATWAPKLHTYYKETMSKLCTHDPGIRFNWATSIFAAATFNLGPQTITYVHQDYFNYVFGWCAITALGNFDYRQGGHLILWDLHLVIQFPPGSTILIPSAYLRHSNTSIGPNERRYSFTQYTAGGIFRYVEDGMRTRESMSKAERKHREAEVRTRVPKGMNMYSTLKELQGSL